MRIARYYCPTAHETFSLLPDCLASRFPGELEAMEQIVADAEAASSLEAAADRTRADAITLTSAVRWLRRRLTVVRTALVALVTLRPELIGGTARLSAVRRALGTTQALVTLRRHAEVPLVVLPRPLGFGRPVVTVRHARAWRQHRMGPDAVGPSG